MPDEKKRAKLEGDADWKKNLAKAKKWAKGREEITAVLKVASSLDTDDPNNPFPTSLTSPTTPMNLLALTSINPVSSNSPPPYHRQGIRCAI
jgi:hypothetical protein